MVGLSFGFSNCLFFSNFQISLVIGFLVVFWLRAVGRSTGQLLEVVADLFLQSQFLLDEVVNVASKFA